MPADKRLDLPAGSEVTPLLAQRTLWLATAMPFEQLAEGVLRLMQVKVCDSVLDRLMQRVGSVAVADRQAALETLKTLSPAARETQLAAEREAQPASGRHATPRRLYISCDGVRFPTRERAVREDGRGNRRLYREMKCGTVFWEDERQGWCKQVISGRDTTEDFGLRLWQLAVRCGIYEADEVIFISDAGGWCEQVHEQHFAQAERVLDWYHLAEHVWQAARAVHDDEQAAANWADTCLTRLEEASGLGLLRLLKRSRAQHKGPARAAITGLIGYLAPRVAFTDYVHYRQQGWQIGSGTMESTCKQVVASRLKRSGCQWSERGAVAMTELISHKLNGTWDTFWQSRPHHRAAA